MSYMKITITVSNGLVGCNMSTTVDVDADEWAMMDDEAREELARNELFSMIEWNYHAEEG